MSLRCHQTWLRTEEPLFLVRRFSKLNASIEFGDFQASHVWGPDGMHCRRTKWSARFAVCFDGSGMHLPTPYKSDRKRLCCFFLLLASGPNRMETEQNIFHCISKMYRYMYNYIYLSLSPDYITLTTDYHIVFQKISSICMISPLFTLYPHYILNRCPWYSHHMPMMSQVYSR